MKTPYDTAGPLEARAMSQIAVQAVRWLWLHRLALGKVAMLDGDPDKGKSLVTLDLGARLSTGRAFPDGCPSGGPANVIVLNAEDGAGDTMRPRLQALGADLDRVFILQRGNCPSGAVLGLPSDIAALDAALERTAARLVIVDPIVAFLDPAVQLGSDCSVRHALAPLADLAEKHQCAIILVRHLNKSGSRHSMYRGGGLFLGNQSRIVSLPCKEETIRGCWSKGGDDWQRFEVPASRIPRIASKSWRRNAARSTRRRFCRNTAVPSRRWRAWSIPISPAVWCRSCLHTSARTARTAFRQRPRGCCVCRALAGSTSASAIPSRPSGARWTPGASCG
jgi:hypothetical protein